ncbi:ABC transporter substrate-binding protein [Anaerovibrio sp.]|uniref:ABC transporter substrate-binding protein n=1 Tax=Anaerovibrio sp. TaxID=1872532 RepID=UPI003F13E8EE
MYEKKHLAAVMLSMLLVLSLLLGGCGNQDTVAGAGYQVTDDQGTVVNFKEKPKRIVSLTMSTDNILLGLVKPDRVVCANVLVDDPVSSNIVELGKDIPNKVRHPKVEEILAMEPDLVIAANWGDIDYVESLRNMGINVVVVKGAKNLQEIRDNISLIAASVGEPERGTRLIGMMDDRLAEIKAKVDKIPQEQRKRVLLISLMSNYGGKDCIYDDACTLAGVTNCLSEYGLQRGDKLTKEMMVQMDPDIIFLPTYNAHGTFDIQGFRDKYMKDPALQQMKAIQAGSIKEPRDAYIYTASQDFCFAVQEIAYTVYGDEFRLEDQQHLSAVE